MFCSGEQDVLRIWRHAARSEERIERHSDLSPYQRLYLHKCKSLRTLGSFQPDALFFGTSPSLTSPLLMSRYPPPLLSDFSPFVPAVVVAVKVRGVCPGEECGRCPCLGTNGE